MSLPSSMADFVPGYRLPQKAYSRFSTGTQASYVTLSRCIPWNIPRESLTLSLSTCASVTLVWDPKGFLCSRDVLCICTLSEFYHGAVVFFRTIIFTFCSFHSYCSFANKNREKTVEERRRQLEVPIYFLVWIPRFFKLLLTKRCVTFVTLLAEGLVRTFPGKMYL